MLLRHQVKQELKTSFGFSYIEVTVTSAGVLREWWGGYQTGEWVENEEHNWRSCYEEGGRGRARWYGIRGFF